jgi:hypothetical protein
MRSIDREADSIKDSKRVSSTESMIDKNVFACASVAYPLVMAMINPFVYQIKKGLNLHLIIFLGCACVDACDAPYHIQLHHRLAIQKD